MGMFGGIASFFFGCQYLKDNEKKLVGIYPHCGIFSSTSLIFCFSWFDLIKSCAITLLSSPFFSSLSLFYIFYFIISLIMIQSYQ